MIKTTKKLMCDICSEEVGEDIQEWRDKKIKDEAIKQGWLIDFPNGGSELLDICPECREQIAKRAVEHSVKLSDGTGNGSASQDIASDGGIFRTLWSCGDCKDDMYYSDVRCCQCGKFRPSAVIKGDD